MKHAANVVSTSKNMKVLPLAIKTVKNIKQLIDTNDMVSRKKKQKPEDHHEQQQQQKEADDQEEVSDEDPESEEEEEEEEEEEDEADDEDKQQQNCVKEPPIKIRKLSYNKTKKKILVQK